MMRAAILPLLISTLLEHLVSQVDGQFLRYGSLTWRQTKAAETGIAVDFKLVTAWRRDYFNRNNLDTPFGGCLSCTGTGTTTSACGSATVPCVLPLVGDRVEIYDYVEVSTASLPTVPTTFTFGGPPEHALTGKRPEDIPKFKPECRQIESESGRRCIPGRVVEAYGNETRVPMDEEDATSMVWVVTELTYVYPWAAATYVAGFQGCCRGVAGDRGLNNNARGAWDIRTTVRVTADSVAMASGTAASPFFAHVPTVLVMKGRPLQFKIHAYDIPERPITYSIGTLDDQGVGLNQNSQPPYGNVMGITINSVTGEVLFPATASTVYERYYNLVVVASVRGPCATYDSLLNPPECLNEIGTSQTGTIRASTDFYIQVVNTGFVGLWPANDCISVNSGMPPGTQKCNRHPIVAAPTTLQRFICGELNTFNVRANDGDGTNQPTVSTPGAFVLRQRQRIILQNKYSASLAPTFPRTETDCCVRQYLNSTAKKLIEANGTYAWNPVCERLETDGLYSYQGRHRLDQYAACFTAVDSGALTSWTGQLVSPPSCVSIAVLRCTKPTIRMIFARGHAMLNGTVYVVPVATGVQFSLEAVDDYQTRILTIFHRADPGIPSTGAQWDDPLCETNSTVQVTCNPLSRNFSFDAGLEHAGVRYPVCFVATNDQIECPAFREDTSPVPYSTFSGEGVRVSQASQPLCIFLDVPGPVIRWVAPTPASEETLTTYMGCLFSITLKAQDNANYFDLDIIPFTDEFSLPSGVAIEDRQCDFIGGQVPPLNATGVGSCPVASRTVRWSPARAQTGQLSRVCFTAAAQSEQFAVRCFFVLVSKCRYCAQEGESLVAIAESFGTDWLQLWGANVHLLNPHKIATFQLINLGALYPARLGDSLSLLAARFRSDLPSTLVIGQEVDCSHSGTLWRL